MLLCAFQVTFVFTNQVNGKLVPMESIISRQLEQKEPNKPRQNIKQKFTPLKLAFNTNHTHVNNKVLPQKRSYPDHANGDDLE